MPSSRDTVARRTPRWQVPDGPRARTDQARHLGRRRLPRPHPRRAAPLLRPRHPPLPVLLRRRRLAPARIAALASDWTREDVETTAKGLIAKRYIVVDDETEEALVRSFIRNDEILKQPKIALAMLTAWAGVASKLLRGVVVHEIKRLHAESPTLPAFTSTSTASGERLRDLLAKPGIDPSPNPSGNPSTYPSGNPSGTPIPKGRVTHRVPLILIPILIRDAPARLVNVEDIDLVRDVDPDDPQWHRILQGRRAALMDGMPLEQAKAIPARSAVLAIGGAR
jgi:hypothetical protein